MKPVLGGLVLLVTGMALALLMVIRVIEANFILSFLSYAASLVGLVLGVSGSVQLGDFWRRPRN